MSIVGWVLIICYVSIIISDVVVAAAKRIFISRNVGVLVSRLVGHLLLCASTRILQLCCRAYKWLLRWVQYNTNGTVGGYGCLCCIMMFRVFVSMSRRI